MFKSRGFEMALRVYHHTSKGLRVCRSKKANLLSNMPEHKQSCLKAAPIGTVKTAWANLSTRSTCLLPQGTFCHSRWPSKKKEISK